MECFRLLLGHFSWIEHQFLSGIRDSRKAGSLWRMMRCVGGVRKSIHQSWLAKGLVLGLLFWGFKGVQEEIPSEEIPSEEASTFQIGSVAFPPGQCISPQLHRYHRLFDQDGYQDNSSASDSPDLAPCDFWVFPKIRGCRMGQLRRWPRLWQRSLTWSHERTSMGPSRSFWNGTTVHCSQRWLLRRGLEFHVCTINKSHHNHYVMPLALISLTLSRHFSLSFIASGRSSALHPLFSHSCYMYVLAGCPAFARPYVGIHRSTSLMSTSLLLQQCPACLVRLIWIVFVMGGRWPYSWCFVDCCDQDLFNIAWNILV